jgi:hypothetical protein
VPPKFPIDAPQACVIRTLALLGFRVVREREHIALVRENAAGTRTPLTLPNYARIKGSTPGISVCRPVFHAPSFSTPTSVAEGKESRLQVHNL